MFITFKSPFPRILKHPIVARIGIVLILPLILTGTNPVLSQASLGTFSQVNTGSDYYIDVNWSGTPASSGCDCFYTDYFFISEPCCPSNRFYQAPGRNHSTSVYSSSAYGYARFSLAPGTTGYSIAGQLGSEGGITFFNPCDFSCVANTVETTTVSTAALKKVENVSQTLFFNVNSMDVTIGWDVVTDIPENLYRLDILKSNQVVYSTNSKSVTSWPVTGLSFGSNHDYIIRTVYTNGEVHSDKPVTVNVPTPNGLISGKITTGPNGTGSPVGGVTVTAERTSSVQGGNLGVLYTATSDPADGSYEIRDIYYGPTNNTSSSATFKITPSLNNRMFDPSTINKTLTFNVPTQSNVNFEDITSFAVSGTIYQPFENTQCPLANVEVIAFKNGQAVSNPVKTNVQGQYSLTIMDPGTYYIRAKIGDHQFVNDSVQVSVQADVSGIDFVDLDRNILKGYVLAGCQEYIGPAMVTITDSLNCVQKILTTNTGSGYFEVELPSRYYRVEVTSITPNDPDIVVNEVLTQFDVQRITLDSMIQLDFIYRKPLELTILGMPSPSCANVPYPVLKQRLIYSLIIKVTEGPYCLSDTGFVVIANAVSGDINTNVTDTVPITNGYAFYELTAGDPNLLGQHLRNISFLARVGNRNSMPLDKSVVVVGSVQRGNTFVTTSPEIPYMILRDPPGDNSYAFLEQDTTVTVSQSFYGQIGGGVKIWAKAKAGIDIFGLKIWGKIGGSIDISGKTTTTDDFIVELNNTQRFETSNDQLVIGPRGDVFVGAALNLRYAAADELSFDLNNCTLVKDTVLTIDPDNVQTQFVYTEGHIRNTLIPNLKEIIKLTPPTDTMTIFNATRSIAVWEQILNLNNELKEEALASGNTENISFDGSSGPITKSYTRSSTINRTIEFATIIDAQIAAEVGFEFRGSG
ncbi:MAG: carboxypeptidase regulatory-like domain-containing protein, partial [Saprospiraceae bacterium]|nr:carboxypeptidase regulatory-like domain-containing protein [Saprospiraceae bacterium]